jgi:hypothetical protein
LKVQKVQIKAEAEVEVEVEVDHEAGLVQDQGKHQYYVII